MSVASDVPARFATLRSYLRFLAQSSIRILTSRQHEVALALLAEPGRMLGAWQRKLISGGTSARKGQAGK